MCCRSEMDQKKILTILWSLWGNKTWNMFRSNPVVCFAYCSNIFGFATVSELWWWHFFSRDSTHSVLCQSLIHIKHPKRVHASDSSSETLKRWPWGQLLCKTDWGTHRDPVLSPRLPYKEHESRPKESSSSLSVRSLVSAWFVALVALQKPFYWNRSDFVTWI